MALSKQALATICNFKVRGWHWGWSVPASLLMLGAAGCHSQPSATTSAVAAPPIVNKPAAVISTPKAPPVQAFAPNSLNIPQWSQGAIIHKVAVRPGQKVFALTFDDGPWPESTHQILDILGANNIKATFFMVGHEVRARPSVARAVRDAGHAIGNHSWDHPSRPRDPVAQVENTDKVIEKELGFRPTLFRPPYGILKNGMAGQAIREKDAVLIWSADCADWKRPGAGSIASMIISQASPGGIALMHDGGGDRSQTVEALPRIIRELRAQGYRFVTIPELLEMRDPNAPKNAPAKTSRSSKTKRSKKRHKKG